MRHTAKKTKKKKGKGDTNQIKYKKVYILKKHREGLTAQRLNRSRTHNGLTYISRRRQIHPTAKKKNSHTLLLFISHQLVRYESSRGHKIDSQIKTNPERTRSEKKKTGKVVEGSGRESKLQRTASPGRDSEEKMQK